MSYVINNTISFHIDLSDLTMTLLRPHCPTMPSLRPHSDLTPTSLRPHCPTMPSLRPHSDLTPTSLRPHSDLTPTSLRPHSDPLIAGASFTRFLTMRLQTRFPSVLANQVISYGSCQFPTLGFVVERYKQVERFLPEAFWKLVG